MKIRTDFVTNSSSSSFVVAFPSEPASSGEVESMLFDQIGTFDTEYYGYIETRKVADRVYRDIVNQKPALLKAIAKEFSSLDYYEGDYAPESTIREGGRNVWSSRDKVNPRYDLGTKVVTRDDGSTYSYQDTNYQLLQKDRRSWGVQKAKLFMKKHEGMVFYTFNYADDGGEGELEHGDIFRKLPHIQISHH